MSYIFPFSSYVMVTFVVIYICTQRSQLHRVPSYHSLVLQERPMYSEQAVIMAERYDGDVEKTGMISRWTEEIAF